MNLDLVYKKFLYENDVARKEHQQKLYEYYRGDKRAIISYLEDALCKTYSDEDLEELQYNFINLTKKIVNQLAIIYSNPVKIDLGEDELTTYYNGILTPKANTKKKKAHRYAKLFDSSLTRVMFDKEKGKIDYIVLPNYLYTVKTSDDDLNKMEMLMYDKEVTNYLDGKKEIITVVWTDKEHYYLDANGNKKPVGNNGLKNPYGVIPFVRLDVSELDSYWGEGLSDVVNVNEQVNFLLTFLVSDNIVLGTGGTILAINLGLNGKGEENSGVRKVRVGRRHPISVENVRNDMKDPNLRHVTSDPMVTEIRNAVDWMIKNIASMQGLDPNTFLTEVKATSGFSKIMDTVLQLEIRRDDIEPCREYEEELFKITRIVNNYHAKSSQGMKEIKDVTFKVDFAEVETLRTTDDKHKERKFNKEHNLESAVDWVMEDNPDIKTKDEARKIINDNKLLNETNFTTTILGEDNDREQELSKS